MSRYIDADALVEVLEGWKRDCNECDYESEAGQAIFDVICQIQDQPTADVVEVRHGEWKEDTEYYDDDYSECNVRKVFCCSLCGRTEKRKEPYCNCDAKMDGKRSEI